MFDDKVILCGSSSYEKIFYFNPEFDSLPKQIKDEPDYVCSFYRRCRRNSPLRI